jgi:hypothetical protein
LNGQRQGGEAARERSGTRSETRRKVVTAREERSGTRSESRRNVVTARRREDEGRRGVGVMREGVVREDDARRALLPPRAMGSSTARTASMQGLQSDMRGIVSARGISAGSAGGAGKGRVSSRQLYSLRDPSPRPGGGERVDGKLLNRALGGGDGMSAVREASWMGARAAGCVTSLHHKGDNKLTDRHQASMLGGGGRGAAAEGEQSTDTGGHRAVCSPRLWLASKKAQNRNTSPVQDSNSSPGAPRPPLPRLERAEVGGGSGGGGPGAMRAPGAQRLAYGGPAANCRLEINSRFESISRFESPLPGGVAGQVRALFGGGGGGGKGGGGGGEEGGGERALGWVPRGYFP